MNQTISNVVKIDPKARSRQDLQHLTETLQRLDWEMQLGLIIKATGLPDNEMLLDRFAKIPGDCLAGRLDHQQLYTFITNTNADLGLGHEWDKWDKLVRAHRIKSYYSIYSDDADEIIRQYNDVTRILGHVPASSAEYNKAKDLYLIEQRSELIEKHSQESASLNHKIEVLIQKEKDIRLELSAQMDSYAKLKAEFDETVRKLNLEIIAAKETNDITRANEITALRDELKLEHERIIAEERMIADQKLMKMYDRTRELEDHYNSKNYVSMQVHMAVQEELDNERKNNRALLVRLNEANLKLEGLQSLHDKTALELSDLQKTLSEQNVRLSVLNSGLESGKITVSDTEISDLHDRIEMLETYLNRFRASSNKWKKVSFEEKEKNTQLQLRVEKLSKTVKSAKANLAAYQKKSNKKQPKVDQESILGIKKSTFSTISMILSSALLPKK